MSPMKPAVRNLNARRNSIDTQGIRATEGSEGKIAKPRPMSPDAPMGEGSIEGTHGYADRLKTYLRTADVAQDAAAAAPNNAAEAQELANAEDAAASRSKEKEKGKEK